MKEFLKNIVSKVYSKIGYHSETVIAIPVAIVSLLLLSEAVFYVLGYSLTDDLQTITHYGIRAVGFLIAAGISIAIKSRSVGDIDQHTCTFGKYAVDSLISCIFLILAILSVFGHSLWL